MADHTREGQPVASPTWDPLTRALLGGLGFASAGFFLIAVVQTPGLDPPPETAALFLVSMTAAAISYLLLGHGLLGSGYIAAMLTGGYVLLSVGVVVSGAYGPAGPETNPIGPIAWILLSVAVIVSAVFAFRERSGSP